MSQFLNIVGLTITHIKQVTEKLNTLRQDDLLKLDQVVSAYLLRRKQNRTQDQGFESQMQSQLSSLQKKNDYLSKELDILTHNFEQEQQRVAACNHRWLKESEQLIQSHPYQQLCRELITQLAAYRQIGSFAVRLQQLRKEGQERHFVNSNLQEFIQKMDEIMRNDEREGGATDYYE